MTKAIENIDKYSILGVFGTHSEFITDYRASSIKYPVSIPMEAIK
jgi:hypothetical protein